VTRLAIPIASGFSFLEAPRWRHGRIWASDFYAHKVVTISSLGEVDEVARVENQPSGLGWLPDGRMLVVSMLDRVVLRQELSGELVLHADLGHLGVGLLNDMLVDARGRAYVGCFGFDLMAGEDVRPTVLTLIDRDGSVSVVADDLWFPNGAVITPDGSTLIVAESFGNRLSAFDIAQDGRLRNRRDWATFGPSPRVGSLKAAFAEMVVCPDGLAMDSEGAIWIADAIGQRAIRVFEGGYVADQVEGMSGVFACALGGTDDPTLYLCAAPTSAAHRRIGKTDGLLLAAKVDVGCPPAGVLDRETSS
jgi:sugar lactone lactonase YvrE